MKKIIALLLAVVMVCCLFAGCNKDNEKPTDPKATDNNTENTTESTEPDSSTEPTGDIVELTWYTVGSGMPDNYDAWKANLDKYLEEKIGVHLDVQVVGWSDWDARRASIVSTNEPYDIIFTNLGTYNNDVKTGAFLDITTMLESTPDLYSLMPESFWDAVKIDGKIYAVPTYKDSSVTNLVCWDKELIEKYDPDYATKTYKNLSELTDVLTAIKDGESDIPSPYILNLNGLDAIYGSRYDNLGTGLPAIGVSYTGSSAKVVPVFEQEDIMTELKTLHEWYNAGIVNADAATLAENPAYRPCFIAQGWPSAAITTWGPQIGKDAVALQYCETVMSTDTIQGSMNCISASSKNPEKALELLQLVNTDTYVRDALKYGLEGDNFTYNDDGTVHVDKDKNWTMAAYTQGTFFTYSRDDTVKVDEMAEVKAQNERAIYSPATGIYIDLTNSKEMIANCNEIWKRYQAELMTGTAEPEATVASMMEEMRDAGFDDIIADLQAQLDAALAG